jgi:hypothetical protein
MFVWQLLEKLKKVLHLSLRLKSSQDTLLIKDATVVILPRDRMISLAHCTPLCYTKS